MVELQIRSKNSPYNLILTFAFNRNKYLLFVQVYKSMGDIASAEALYNHYSVVPEEGSPWANWRKIAFMHLKPRRMFVQPNTEIQGECFLLFLNELGLLFQ